MWVWRLRKRCDKIDTMNHVVTTCMPRLFTNINSTSLYTTLYVAMDTVLGGLKSTWHKAWIARESEENQMISLTHADLSLCCWKIHEGLLINKKKTIFTFEAYFYLNHMASLHIIEREI